MSVPEEEIDRLYGLPLDEFTRARDELARRRPPSSRASHTARRLAHRGRPRAPEERPAHRGARAARLRGAGWTGHAGGPAAPGQAGIGERGAPPCPRPDARAARARDAG